MKFSYSFVVIICCLARHLQCVSLKLRVKKGNYFNEDPEMADSNRVPIINIHMEDHDSDPINFRRFDGERNSYTSRVEELLNSYVNEKRALTHVVTLQLSKIAQLTDIAESTNKIMDLMVSEGESGVDKQKNAHTHIK